MTQAVEHHAINAVAALVGADHVLRDDESCRYFASDLAFEPHTPPLAVVFPGSRDEALRVIRLAADEGLAIVARGGGLSYTGGYVPQEAHSIVLDTARLTHILEINEDDRYATVEAGVTWEVLHRELGHRGLRVPHFGPATGRVSTIGGGLSQNTVLFGSARYGTAAENVLSVEVGLADGSRIRTGSAAMEEGSPFFRYHGPDLTGLFLGDGGALGVKLSATLRLIPAPEEIGYASFAYPTFEAMLNALAEVARSRLAADVLGIGNYVLPDHDATKASPVLHLVAEGFSERDVSERLSRLRTICAHQGHEVEPTVPRFLRAEPFSFVTSLLDPEGRLQSWTHGIVPFSRALHVFSEIVAYLNSEAHLIERHALSIKISSAVVGTGILLEPVIHWRGKPRPLHLKGLGGTPEVWKGAVDDGATEAAEQVRRGLRDLFRFEHAAHLQVGKFYSFREGLSDDAVRLLHRLKHAVDPHNRMNPGALGLL